MNNVIGGTVHLDDVRFSYDNGATWVLDGVDLDIRSGECVCLIGPNGAGKSTLARLVAGLAAPDSGSVRLLGCAVFGDDGPHAESYRTARRGIGAVFQNPEDQIVTTVLEDDVAFGPENLAVERDEIGRRIDSALQCVDLTDLRMADPTRFSGGQQQRAAIAGMLAMHPRLLVLDEPTAMLDAASRAEVMAVLDTLHASGTTIVHVTHRTEETLHADRVLQLEDGRIADVSPGKSAAAIRPSHRMTEQQSPAPGATEHSPSMSKAKEQTPPAPKMALQEPTTPLVSLDHVTFAYPDAVSPVLADVSLHINAGETVALMGANGSGKSTLAKLVCALGKPSSGDITVAGIAVARRDGRHMRYANRRQLKALRGAVGYVMQHPERQLFAQTVAEDVAYGPRNQGLGDKQATERVGQALRLLHIEHLAERSPFALSVGQQRLAAIAGVIACRPRLLVMDEPTAGLDARARAYVRELIDSLHDSGVAVLLITHDSDEARQLADRVIELGGESEQDKSSHRRLKQDNTSRHSEQDQPSRCHSERAKRVEESPIARLDPRVKLPALLALMLCAFAIGNATQLAVGALAVLAIVIASRIKPGRLLRSIHGFLVLFVLMGLLNVFFVRTGTALFTFGSFSVTDEGLATAGLYICRFAMVIILGAVFLETTTPTAITDALASLLSPLRRLGLHTQETALVLSLALRFIPTLVGEVRSIFDAQSARGGSIETGSAFQRIRAMGAIIVPVFAGALRHADNLSLALDARCYEQGLTRTHWHLLRLGFNDCLFALFTLAAIAAILLLGLLP
ncbi:energy-coupling factor transporter ATPase [Bifidobacterium panos]|uniref:Cobalt ABC transporter n=1 Tax=Bifidobacterium panos TaxID=2675321 RepID=A0ABX1SV76_9BIFI|nr:energy-coupling factor transporter ATPase [Bifidobacterium sp. DSM 109963]NMN01730.1 cobalt ABC transporter [Bifidobacterium sp. DSM 109963]